MRMRYIRTTKRLNNELHGNSICLHTKTAHTFVVWAAVFITVVMGYDGNVKAWLFVMCIISL